MVSMTTTDATIHTAPDDRDFDTFEDQPSADLYREIHKGIRYAMFHATIRSMCAIKASI